MGTLHDRNPDTEKTGVVQPPKYWCLHDIALYQELLRILHDEYICKYDENVSRISSESESLCEVDVSANKRKGPANHIPVHIRANKSAAFRSPELYAMGVEAIPHTSRYVYVCVCVCVCVGPY